MPKKKRVPDHIETSLVQSEIPEEVVESGNVFMWLMNEQSETYRKLYEKTGDTMYVWSAIRIYFSYGAEPGGDISPSLVQKGIQLPKWIHDYILESSVSLLAKHNRGRSINDVGGLIGFKGNRIFRKSHDERDRHHALSFLKNLLVKQPELKTPEKIDLAYVETAEWCEKNSIKAEPDTIERWWKDREK